MGNNNRVSSAMIAGIERIMSHKDYIMGSLTVDEFNTLLQQELSNDNVYNAKAKKIEKVFNAIRYQFETGARESWFAKPNVSQTSVLPELNAQQTQKDLPDAPINVSLDVQNNSVVGCCIGLKVEAPLMRQKDNLLMCFELSSNEQPLLKVNLQIS